VGYAYLLFPYSGTTDLTVAGVSLEWSPVGLDIGLTEIARHEPASRSWPVRWQWQLPAGAYVLRAETADASLGSMFDLKPPPVSMAVHRLDEGGRQAAAAVGWLTASRNLLAVAGDPEASRPLAERIAAPWRGALPFTSGHLDLPFDLPTPGKLEFAARYEGEMPLRVERLVLLAASVVPSPPGPP
jgi:hypothetical protein